VLPFEVLTIKSTEKCLRLRIFLSTTYQNQLVFFALNKVIDRDIL
jgi:hypothetical protein